MSLLDALGVPTELRGRSQEVCISPADVLGQGGFGCVYKSIVAGKPGAVKVVPVARFRTIDELKAVVGGYIQAAQ